MADMPDLPTMQPNGSPTPQPTLSPTVPLDRFNRQSQKLKETIEALEAITSERDSLSSQVGTSEALASQVKDLRTQIKTQAQGYDERIAMANIGLIDGEGQDLARFYFSRADEKTRGDFPAWLKAQADKPDDAAKGLQPYLSSIQADPADPPVTSPATPTTPGLPPADRAVKPMPAVHTGTSTDAILGSSPEQYRAMRDALKAEYAQKR